MIVELTEAERVLVQTRYSVGEATTLAWRAFGKAIGVQVDDPMMVIDGDGSQVEPVTRRRFYLEEAEGSRFLSLGHVGCWDGGAMRSLSPHCTYVSFNVASDWSFVAFYGWHRPKGASRIISKAPDGRSPYLTLDQLSSMGILIGVMKRRIASASAVS